MAELSGRFQYPVLALSSQRNIQDKSADLSLSFDEDKSEYFADSSLLYRVQTAPSVVAARGDRAQFGGGAAQFTGIEDGGIAALPHRTALFAPNSRLSDFSIEFWLYPANMANGEQLVSWTASRRNAGGDSVFQRLRCFSMRNKIEWNFIDFFTSADETRRLSLTITSRGAVLPRVWSHHLLRFDAASGLLEYLIDGRLENVAYATVSGREGGDVYTPLLGSGASLVLGSRYTGLMDEFRIYGRLQEKPELSRYPLAGGRAETRFLDLGTTNTELLRIETKLAWDTASKKRNSPTGADSSEIRIFARSGDSQYGWKDDEASWIPIPAGVDLGGHIRGRYLQLAVVLYPSGNGEASPYLEELRLVYQRDEAPPPPSYTTAIAGDGEVELRWKASPDPDLGGYLIYYGSASGEYLGTEALLGASPIDVGKRLSFVIDGLKNGTLYYFSIAAYDRALPRHIGEFSREVSARPARMLR
ncbi:hypothetical protein MASR2M78_30600 [Treponema sp.]